jgi:hypothetical protein
VSLVNPPDGGAADLDSSLGQPTATLRVRFKGWAGRAVGATALGEVTATDLRTVERFALYLDSQRTVTVVPGRYRITARLPSGEVLAERVTAVAGTETLVEFGPLPSPHEWLEFECFLGIADRAGSEGEPSGPALTDLPGTWLRIWRRRAGVWELTPRYGWQDQDNWTALYQVDPDESGILRFLQVGGLSIPWRLVALPPTPVPLSVLIRSSRLPTEANGGLAVKLTTWDRDAESLLRYEELGAMDSADAISSGFIEAEQRRLQVDLSEDALERAEEYARTKIVNPSRAAIGFYYLLRTMALERLHEWPNNFANWIGWLPDAAVIHASQVLRSSPIDLDLARRRLADAARLAPPVYTEGLRLLFEALHVLRADPGLTDRAQAEVGAALARVTPYAEACDWTEAITTFLGTHPEEPSLKLHLGIPEVGPIEFITVPT